MSGHFLYDLRATFERQASRPALLYRGRTTTYAELAAAASRAAAMFQSAGVIAGDRIVLFTSEKLPFLMGHLGALYAGAVPLPLNPRFTREEMRFFLRDCTARVVVAGSEQRPLIDSLAAEMADPPIVIVDRSLLDPPNAALHEPDAAAQDPC